MFLNLVRYIKKYGVIKTINSIFSETYKIIVIRLRSTYQKIIEIRHYFTVDYLIHRRRMQNSQKLYRQLGGRIKYGLFRGFSIISSNNWSRGDIGNMLLGIYEQEVLDILSQINAKYHTLIDLGAADGYYAVGGLVNKTFKQVYCYETSVIGRENISQNATYNHVQDKIKIYGRADQHFYKDLLGEGVDFGKCVIICDIEGGEFDIFNDTTLSNLKNSYIIIEIHDWHKNGAARYRKLKKKASQYFNLKEVQTGSRDLSTFPEIQKLKDNDRWLFCSEGRHYLQTWLILEPKKNTKRTGK